MSEKTFFLKPSEIYITNQPYIIRTILGSCVSIIFYHNNSKTIGITHSILPEKKKHIGLSCKKNDFKYTDCSFFYLLKKFLELKIPLQELKVCLVGGANKNFNSDFSLNIGKKNYETAFNLINENNLNLIYKNIGGEKGRKIIFYSNSGKIELYYL